MDVVIVGRGDDVATQRICEAAGARLIPQTGKGFGGALRDGIGQE